MERDWFYKAKNGDGNALNMIVESNYDFVYRYFYKLTFNKEEAEDLAQATFEKFLKNIRKLDYRSKLSTLLITIGTNIFRDKKRREKHFMMKPIDDTLAIPEKDNTAKALLMSLPVEQRKLFILKYYYGYTNKEIGEILGLPEGTIKSKFHYIIKDLRDKRGEWYE